MVGQMRRRLSGTTRSPFTPEGMERDPVTGRAVVVVPTYDEAENLPELAERLLALRPEVDVLVVDDGSPDGTGGIADRIAASNPRFRVLHRTADKGYASSCRDGIGAALARAYDYVLTMDADLSHDPAVIPTLLEKAEGGADLVIGSRYVPGGGLVVEWGRARRAVSRSGSAYARTMIGAPVMDCTSGYRCYRAETLRAARVDETTSQGYFFCIEALARMLDNGASVTEVPIVYVDRRAGVSKISHGIVVEAFASTTGLGVKRLLRGGRRGGKRGQAAGRADAVADDTGR
jgi:dolichol-phosphate mannosyltransferase